MHSERSVSKQLFLVLLLTVGFLAGCGSADPSTGALGGGVPTGPSGPNEGAARTQNSLDGPILRQAELASFRVVHDWGSGFTGEVTITNSTDQPIEDWQATFRMPASITSIWNADRLSSPVGEHRVIAKSYNRTIRPGQTITFGFNGAPGGAAAQASDLILNWAQAPGQPDPTPTPDPAPDPTPEPTPDPEPGPEPDPIPEPQAEVDYRITSDWGHGFGARVVISNPDSSVLSDWTLTFELEAQISDLWNGQILSREGNTYTVGAASWNRQIPAGGSVDFGFNAAPRGSAATARNFRLNGTPVGSDPAPDPAPTPDPDPTPDPTPTPDPDPTPNPTPVPPAMGFYSTDGARIVDAQGNTVLLNGVNWFGMETETFAPHGLWTRSMTEMLDEMRNLGYTTLRIPYSNEAFRSGSVPNGIDFHQNPQLVGLNALEILDVLVDEAGKREMKILLDRHRPTSRGQSDLWYTAEVSEEQWISDWEMLALRYRGNPTVIGADLHNEPHGRATWGSGSTTTDWRLAAERAGNRILAVNPDWLIVVEGVETYNGQNYWWGGNLRGAKDHPVRLTASNKLVYSPHDYATSVYQQTWFSAPDFPQNLEGIWDANWGYLLKENIAPVLLGEFGTAYTAQVDRVWLATLVEYLHRNGASFTYWCWNPNSSDTGGLLKSDWRTLEADKHEALLPLLQR